MVCVVLCWIG